MPVITIFTATGTQGSSVLEAVLRDGRYTPRAVTRKLDSPAAKALISRGIEVVEGNMWDRESVKRAMRGSEAVFGNTNFWDPEVFPADPQGKGEVVQGKNLVDAAKEEGVKFFIWSSLPSATKASNGVFTHAYHVDNKAIIADYLKESGVPFAVLITAWFPENLWNFNLLAKTDTGYSITVPTWGPDNIQRSTWVGHDLGNAAVALLTNYTDPSKEVLGKSFQAISFTFKYPELVKALSKAIGKEVVFISPETTGSPEYDEQFLVQTKYPLYGDTPVPNPELVALGVEFGSLEEFISTEVVKRFS
ncbi:hypothetical protein FB45DRAFT_907054 [Roridomyces roridus]|uniref:NmrA-like domain-containing protein n=1 Tax=Roridomyces roridus TaxID=1738132 RepID=A0AAD7C1B9_9AGAR|nr:hypothetical protein FB45DRAFT_907054 [Roridomyces roridus]